MVTYFLCTAHSKAGVDGIPFCYLSIWKRTIPNAWLALIAMGPLDSSNHAIFKTG